MNSLYILFVLVLIGIPGLMFLIAFLCCFRKSYRNPIRTVWKARKVFKFPRIKIYFGKYSGWGYHEIDTFIFSLYSSDVLWKDKYDSPRLEYEPQISIVFFKYLQLYIRFVSPIPKDPIDDDYYEQMIWFLNYSDGDIKKAKETWPWTKWNNEGESTWNDNYLKT